MRPNRGAASRIDRGRTGVWLPGNSVVVAVQTEEALRIPACPNDLPEPRPARPAAAPMLRPSVTPGVHPGHGRGLFSYLAAVWVPEPANAWRPFTSSALA
jgi:hypothetical protein